MNVKLYIIVFFVISFFSFRLVAQTPTKEDCLGAIPICKTSYDEPDPYLYSGEGNYPSEIMVSATQDCRPPEKNGVWYIFTAQTSGKLKFSITPHRQIDDYDWVVFDLTKGTCADLSTSNVNKYIVSTNTYGADEGKINGSTGADSDSTGGTSGSCNGPGEKGTRFNDDITVIQGNTYVLYISNWTKSTYGYFIDFGKSTANIYDNSGPSISNFKSKDSLCVGSNQLQVSFSENVLCSSVASSSFSLTGNGIAVSGVESDLCKKGSTMSRDYKLNLSSPLTKGNYTLNLNNSIIDVCNNNSVAVQVSFEVKEIEFVKTRVTDVFPCFGLNNGMIQIDAKGGYGELSYSLNSNTVFQKSNSFSALNTGTFNVKIKDEAGCYSGAYSAIVSQPLKLEFGASTVKEITCFGDKNGEWNIEAKGGTGLLKYQLDNEAFVTKADFKNFDKGTYLLTVKDSLGCTISTTQEIKEPQKVTLDNVEVTHIVCNAAENSGVIKFIASGGTGGLHYLLNDSVRNLTGSFSELKAGNYLWEIRDDFGCKADNSQPIDLKTLPCLSVPSAFSPNGDGKNDVWEIDNISAYPNATILVFDRWSKIVFESKGYNTPWDGRKSKGFLPVDSYFYLIDLRDGNPPLTGVITLLK